VPTAAAKSLDNWNVLGLQGTGSADFTIDSAFVPEALAFQIGSKPLRGGPNLRLGVAGLIGHTVPAVALGVARRALDDLIGFAREKQRGYLVRQTIGDRQAFQAFLATADLRLKAARALMLENGLQLADVAVSGADTAPIEAEIRAAGTWVTEQALQISSDIIRWAGGEAIRQGSRFERALRDIQVASTHYCISNTSLESQGQYLLGIADVPAEA
jgi:alkylation response protein AidB-like acyl-CoA dehydrogenase